MGDPKKIRKKYQTPRHPWIKARIEEEKEILREYGMKNKKEIWKMESKLRDFSNRAKTLIVARNAQADKEREELLARLKSLGLIQPESGLDDILGLKMRNILERRLQTLVYKKNLSRSMKQARQFIVHGHVKIGENSVTHPSYLVPISEESMITFSSYSTLNNPEHAERVMQSEAQVKKKAKKEEERAMRRERDDKRGGKFNKRKPMRRGREENKGRGKA